MDGPSCAEASPFQERGLGGNNQGSEVLRIDLDFEPRGHDVLKSFTEKLCVTLRLFGAPNAVLLSARSNLMRLCLSVDETVVCSKVKKFCESFSARLLDTEHQEVPLDGNFGRWIDARLGEGASTKGRKRCQGPWQNACELSESLMKMKGCLGHASDWMVFNSKRDHRAKVTESRPDGEFVFLAKEAIRPILDEIRAGLDWEDILLTSPPKSTGSTQAKRALGGKAGGLFRFNHDVREVKTVLAKIAWEKKIQNGVTKFPLSHSRGREGRRRFDHLGDERIDESCEWEDPEVSVRPVFTSDGEVHLERSLRYPRSEVEWDAFVKAEARADIARGVSRKVSATAVREAGGKIRMVTSGSQAGATVGGIWQQRVLREMKKLEFFPSMSRVITGDLIDRVLGAVGDLAASSDFTAATDLLDPRLTNWILAYLTEGYPYYDVVMDDNADKVIEYGPIPKVFAKEPKGGLLIRGQWFQEVQTGGLVVRYHGREVRLTKEFPRATKRCGQLMGQITSFPLLCLANAACTLAAYALHGVPLDVARHRFIINGDDRLARSSRAIEDTFWAISGSIGLKRSPGKSHESTKFAVINSQAYVFRRGNWARIQVLRGSLFHGIMKLETDEFKPSHVVTALFEHMPRRSVQAAIPIWLSMWGDQIKKECAGRNLFLPVALNGMGQEPPPGWKWHITRKQQLVASHLILTQPHACFDHGPQWPAPRPAGGVEAQPWDIPTASPDAGSIEAELAVFQSRLARRVAHVVLKQSREAVCCGQVRHADCPCGRTIEECPEARPRVFKQPCECGDYRDRAWEAARDRPEPECHHKPTYSVQWACPCHGTSMVWRKSEVKIRPVLPVRRIRNCVRPTTVYMAGSGSGQRTRPPSALLWGFDQEKFGGVKWRPQADLPRAHAQMMMEIDIAIAETTGDWRKLV